MAVSPKERRMFLLDVKGLAQKNYWQIKRHPPRADLFYVLAVVPQGAPNEFFVLTQDEVNAGISAEFERLKPERRTLGQIANRLGLRWKDAVLFRDRWEILPP
jgi:hypothetical protein